MARASANKIVDLVVTARRNQIKNREIIDQMINLGVEPLEAPTILEAVDNGYKSGFCSSIESENYDTKELRPLFQMAFDRGRASVRGRYRSVSKNSVLVMWVLVLLVLGCTLGLLM